jgi:spore coat protein CotH
MTPSLRRFALLSAASAVLLCAPGRAASPAIGAGTVQQLSAADLFNDAVVHDVRLSINSKDLALLRANFQLNTYYPADFTWQGQRVRNVAIRSRGAGSRNPTKLGLRIDFNRYTQGQQFLGLTSLVLDNLWQDDAMLREVLAMALYRRLGQPAPREAFCRLYINNVYQGLYAVVEPIDALFTARTFGDPTGYLFEFKYLNPFYATYLGPALGAYRERFEPQTHELAPEATLFDNLHNLFLEANGPDDAVWRARTGEYIDLAALMTYVGIEAFLAENDGFLGYAGMNNMYWYRRAGSRQHRVLPWDKDFGFTFLDSSVLRSVDENVLVRRALAEGDLRTTFLDAAVESADAADQDAWLMSEIVRLEALTAVARAEDTRKQFSDARVAEAIEFLKVFAATRSAFVRAEVARLR